MNGKVLTVAEFIELEMTCPLTMIPTIYGLKLLDHVQLGNSTCNSLHDFFRSKTYSTVKWSIAPVTYSTNVQWNAVECDAYYAPLQVTHRIASFYPHHVHSNIGEQIAWRGGLITIIPLSYFCFFYIFSSSCFLDQNIFGIIRQLFLSTDPPIDRLRWDCVVVAQFPSFF